MKKFSDLFFDFLKKHNENFTDRKSFEKTPAYILSTYKTELLEHIEDPVLKKIVADSTLFLQSEDKIIIKVKDSTQFFVLQLYKEKILAQIQQLINKYTEDSALCNFSIEILHL